MKPLNGIGVKSGSEPYAFLSPLDLATLFYVLFTTGYIFTGFAGLNDIFPHLFIRAALTAMIFVLAFLNKRYPNQLVSFAKNLYPLLFLSFFYAETSYLKNILVGANLDPSFSQLEQAVFGCQPSIEFCKWMPHPWFNELMNLSYFSYYLITAVVCFAIYFKRREESYRAIFIVMLSFYMYYIIYAVLPVVGPQFYFSAADASIPRPYLFGKIMGYLINTAEQPTGAFPSSHVGIALILSWVSYRYLRQLSYFILPFAIGICFATVYLKAHYLLDVIGGILTVPVFIFVSNSVFNILHRKLASKPA